MCTDQELLKRWKSILQRNTPKAPADRSAEIIPGKKYRDGRGRMVTVLSVSPHKITFSREGCEKDCELSRKEFYKFIEVQL
ncbi:DUF4222 domain-containing protein [Trabulsiella odontotermitis]|uniref:DUF4222 domain-containing protein n=1 Tax=Trabulsiella odontotermitis TaxID=379893 RepID=A0A0L0GXJ7_9ENTR|nr:DUF4222 domain-containing protein [Trabulsiella odontotermitis]KNC93637.1 hypothetical protein GM31_18830 [Trabulsiella odontotermitis]